MQTCGEVWPGPQDSSSPASLYVSEAAALTVTLGPWVTQDSVSMIHEQQIRAEVLQSTDGLQIRSCSTFPPSLSSLKNPLPLFLCQFPWRSGEAQWSELRENPGLDGSVTVHEVTSSDMSTTMTWTSCTKAQIKKGPTSRGEETWISCADPLPISLSLFKSMFLVQFWT